jgi:hypothetical protein
MIKRTGNKKIMFIERVFEDQWLTESRIEGRQSSLRMKLSFRMLKNRF